MPAQTNGKVLSQQTATIGEPVQRLLVFMAGGINSFKDKIMFEIYKENVYSGEYRVVYFSELDDHNKDKEIDRAMKGDHFFDGFILSLKKDRAMKQIEDILEKLNDGETLDDQYMNKYLEEFLAD